MQDMMNKITVPIAGLMLGLASAGNLLSYHGAILKSLFGIIAFIILLLFILKLITNHKHIQEDLHNPAVSGVTSTFPMSIVVLSAYINLFLPNIAYAMWIIGILMQCVIIIYFTKKFIFNFDIKRVFPCYFIVYVGIAVGSIVAPVFNATNIGKVLFWFGFVSYLILLPVISYRLFVIKSIPEPVIPTITIFAAPASLCLAGYLNSFETVNMNIFWLLVSLSLITLFAVLLYMPKMLKLKFYPSYSAFTFPLVISAIAMQSTNNLLIKMNLVMPVLQYITYFLELLAVIFVIYVLIHYTNFLFIETEK